MISLVIVAALLFGYWTYVSDRHAYYVQRNLRLLSSFSEQLDASFAQQQTFVRNYARADQGWDPKEREKLLPGFEPGDCTTEAYPGAAGQSDAQIQSAVKPMPREEISSYALRSHGPEQWLEIAWAGNIPKETAIPDPALYQPASADSVGKHLCRQIPLSKILDPLLNNERFGAFDAVFLADESGHVLYSMAPPHASSLLWQSAQKKDKPDAGAIVAPKVVLTDLASAEEIGGGFLDRDRKGITPSALTKSSRHIEVEVSGDRYLLFTHPYPFGKPVPAVDAVKEEPAAGGMGAPVKTKEPKPAEHGWIVGGIVEKHRFSSDVRAISASKIALAIAMCVLVVCAWPFLRISLMTERQPLTITDVVLLGVCSTVAVMMLTLTILDWMAYYRLGVQTNSQLTTFAYKLEHDFTRNIVAANDALEGIRKWSLNHVWRTNNESALLRRRAPGGDIDVCLLYDDPNVARYPYFTAFAWIDRDGMQRYKASTTTKLPLLSVAERRYFNDAHNRNMWDARPRRDGGERYPYALEWVQSLSTGETQAVVAKNTGLPDLPVIALTTQILDVSEAVPPPGISFAIIDEQGNVIYHPDEQRIGHEDFFAETDFNRELRGAVLSRTDAFVTCPYWGEDQRMFIHPLANTSWTLVSFRGKRLMRALNIESVLLTMLALIGNAVPYVLLAALVLLVAPWYRAPSLWPNPRRNDDYARLAGVMALAGGAFLLSIYAVTPGDLMPIVVIFPAQAMLSGYVLLHGRDMRRMSLLAFGGWIVTTILLVWNVATSHIDAELLVSEKPARMRWLLIAAVLFESRVALNTMVQSKRETRQPNAIPLKWVVWLLAATVLAVVGSWRLPMPEWSEAIGGHYLVMALIILGAAAVYKTMIASQRAEARRTMIRERFAALGSTEGRRVAVTWIAASVAITVAAALATIEDIRWIALLVVLQAIAATFWIYSSRWRVLFRLAIWLIWGALVIALFIYCDNHKIWRAPEFENWAQTGIPVALAIALLATLIAADGQRCRQHANRLVQRIGSLPFPHSYRAAGVLTLIVGAALPTGGYFKLGSRVEQEALVKFAQLRLASGIEQRINRIGKMLCTDEDGAPLCIGGATTETARRDGLHYLLPSTWDTLWTLDDQPPRRSSEELASGEAPHEVLAKFIPHYSEDSVAMRQLYGSASSDPLWKWTPVGRLLRLDRLVRFESRAVEALWPGSKIHQQSLRLTSYVPLLFPWVVSLKTGRHYVSSPLALTPAASDSFFTGGDFAYTVLVISLIAGVIVMLIWIVRFMTDRVLLLNVRDPLWIEGRSTVGDHVFLIRRRETDLRNIIGRIKADRDVIYDLRFKAINGLDQWDDAMKALDAAGAQNVRILDFEHCVKESALDEEMLQRAEQLVARADSKVTIICSYTPSYILGLQKTPKKLAERCKRFLAGFVCVDWDEICFRRVERRKVLSRRDESMKEWTVQQLLAAIYKNEQQAAQQRQTHAQEWMDDETSSSLVLRRLSADIRLDLDREQILDELRDRAQAHYDSLWAGCSTDEKLLLFHLARHGFANAKNRLMLRRLIARGLVRRSPNLELMSESFRLYVLTAGARENLPATSRSVESEGVLRPLRVPIFIVVISFLLLLFTTQKDLMTLTTGFAAAITTGIPMLVNLFGMFTQRRLESMPKIR